MAKSGVKKIDTSSFDETIAKFNTAVGVFQNAMSTMNNQTNRLLNCWEGKGREAFKKEYIRLKTAIKDETENLITIKNDLAAVKASYAEWDSNTSKVISENTLEGGV